MPRSHMSHMRRVLNTRNCMWCTEGSAHAQFVLYPYHQTTCGMCRAICNADALHDVGHYYGQESKSADFRQWKGCADVAR